jgi:putative NIF3 family GTP cyclohydrolase 1 type 2
MKRDGLSRTFDEFIQRAPVVIGDEDACALRLVVGAHVKGEISEPNVHTARESVIAYVAAGHRATERLAAQHGHVHRCMRIENPL